MPGLVLRNRVAMAPMTTWASNDDGTVSDEEDAYYRRREKTSAWSSPAARTCKRMVSASPANLPPTMIGSFRACLRKLALAAKSGGASATLLIFHAGVKTLPTLVSDVVAASEIEGDAGPFASAILPRALPEEEILDIIRAFADTTRRAIVAGFDGVELHGAHGFLIQNFFSPHSNRREDQWGGSLANRMRFPLAVVAAVARTIEEHADRPFALGYLISVEEGVDGGLQIADSLELVTRLIDAGANYIHASLGSALDQKPSTGRPDATIVSVLHEHIDGRVPLIAAGGIGTSGQAERALEMGLSVAAVGQGFVMNPDWIARARDGRDSEIHLSISARDVARASIPHAR